MGESARAALAMNSIDALLAGLIDYAGLFPPASESMRQAVANYAEYSRGADREALGRFIVPVSRLEELEECAAELLPRGDRSSPWRVSALASGDIADAARAITDFNRRHSAAAAGLAVIDVVELKAAAPAEIAAQRAELPAELTAYFEIPVDGEVDPMVRAAGAAGSRAKIRTGGVTADAFPPVDAVIGFIASCVGAGVPFKATAGLHHPLGGEFRLTYAPDSPRGRMYGYINIFLAATLILNGESAETARAALLETEPGSLAFEGETLVWRDRRVSCRDIQRCREFAISFGSCSFREPIDELSRLTVRRD